MMKYTAHPIQHCKPAYRTIRSLNFLTAGGEKNLRRCEARLQNSEAFRFAQGGNTVKPALDTGNTEKVADMNNMNLFSLALLGFGFNLSSVSTVIHSIWLFCKQDHCSQWQTNVTDKMVILNYMSQWRAANK
jgi:hypothetical protein